MTNSEFETVYYPRYRGVIETIARKFARDDLDLFDDLVSVGTIGLLYADPAKAGKNTDAFLRQIIRNKIVDHMRWLNLRDFPRLDAMLAHNLFDIVADPVTGETVLARTGSAAQHDDRWRRSPWGVIQRTATDVDDED